MTIFLVCVSVLALATLVYLAIVVSATVTVALEALERIAVSNEALRTVEETEQQQRADLSGTLAALRTGDGKRLLRERLARHLGRALKK